MNTKPFFSIALVLLLVACGHFSKKSATPTTAPLCDPKGCEQKVSPSIDGEISLVKPVSVAPEITSLEGLASIKPKAAYDLALKYFRGDGIAQDSLESLKWMRHAADQGQLAAQKALGLLYLTGLDDIRADPQEAEKWLKLAAAKGDKESEALVLEAKRAKRANQKKWKNEKYWRNYAHRCWHTDYTYFGNWH